jgi:hypothetical protein
MLEVERVGQRPRPRPLGRKPELAPIQEINLFEFYLEFGFFANFGYLYKGI